MKGGFQLQNAAAAIMAIQSLGFKKSLASQNISNGLQQAKLPGRYELICNQPQIIVDVAHNEQSARMLSELLAEYPVEGKTIAVVAMLSDKAVREVLSTVKSEIDYWLSAGLTVPRGLSAKNMAQAVRELDADVKLCDCESVTDACQQARTLVADNDRIIVFGSFYTVAEATNYFNANINTDV